MTEFKNIMNIFNKDVDISFMEYFLSLIENKNSAIKISHTNITLNYNLITLDAFLDLVYSCDNLRRETFIP